jgi:hypothetical protein
LGQLAGVAVSRAKTQTLVGAAGARALVLEPLTMTIGGG